MNQKNPKCEAPGKCPFCGMGRLDRRMGRLDNYLQCNVCKRYVDPDFAKIGENKNRKTQYRFPFGYRIAVIFAAIILPLFISKESFIYWIIALSIGYWACKKYIPNRGRIRKTRNQYAEQILSLVERDITPPPFAVYLRPHNVKSKGVTTWGEVGPWTGPSYKLEDVISNSLQKELPLIGLGIKWEDTAPGIACVSDEVWKEKVKKLIGLAKTVFFVPGGGRGLLWELEFIIESKQLQKCLFVYDSTQKLKKDETQRFKAFGLEIPSNNKNSVTRMLVCYNNERVIEGCCKLPPLKKTKKIESVIQNFTTQHSVNKPNRELAANKKQELTFNKRISV